MIEAAGHIFLLPNLPTYGTEVVQDMVMGGTPAANAAASALAWEQTLELLEVTLR